MNVEINTSGTSYDVFNFIIRFSMFYVEQKNKNKGKLYNFIGEEFTVNIFVFILYLPFLFSTIRLLTCIFSVVWSNLFPK